MTRRLPGSTLFPYTTLFRSLKKSRPLPAGPLSHTATVKFSSSVSPTTWPVPSNSAPLVGSLQALELVRNALIPVPGIVGPTSSVSGKRSEEHTSELQSPTNIVWRLLCRNEQAVGEPGPICPVP